MPENTASLERIRRNKGNRVVMQISLLLDRTRGDTLTAQLAGQLRDAIRLGRIAPGVRLPSSRRLSEQLGIGRNTVVRAYETLEIESYVESRPASGMFATMPPAMPRPEPRFGDQPQRAASTPNGTPIGVRVNGRDMAPAISTRPGTRIEPVATSRARLSFDFAPGLPNANLFPLKTWRRLLQTCLARGGPPGLPQTGDLFGLTALRAAIASHLGAARGIVAEPGQIAIVSGAREAIAIAIRLLVRPGALVCVEDPCYRPAVAAFQAAEAELRAAVERAVADLDAVTSVFQALLRIAEIKAGSRRSAFAELDLGQVRHLKERFGVTINDVILAVCSGALRTHLAAHDHLAGSEQEAGSPLVAVVPISVRGDSPDDDLGNRLSAMFVPLANDLSEPLDRLRSIAAASATAKAQERAIGYGPMASALSEAVPPALARPVIQLGIALGALRRARAGNLMISNVPGPDFALYFAGMKMVAAYPLGPVVDGVALNITVQSYNGTLFVGLNASASAVPDLPALARSIARELDAMTAAAENAYDRMGSIERRARTARMGRLAS